MKRIINFLRSESFVFIAILFVVTGQVIHTAYLFENVRQVDLSFSAGGTQVVAFNWIHALICASAIEAAILMFILNGKKIPAQIYALASFAANLLYYKQWSSNWENILTSTLISAMLSGSIWFFSGLFAEKVGYAEKSNNNSEKDQEDITERAVQLFGTKA